MQNNTVKIGRDVFPIASPAEAVATWVAARAAYNWGASEAPRVSLTWQGVTYRIAYNGRIFARGGQPALLLN